MHPRGVALINAVTIVAEVGDFSRFGNPRQLMAYLGLVPSEHSGGSAVRTGGITKAGGEAVRSHEPDCRHRALGLKLTILEDREALARIRHRLTPRQIGGERLEVVRRRCRTKAARGSSRPRW